MRVLFVTTGLGVGGAEISLLNIIEHLGRDIEPHVVSLSGDGPIGERFRALGVPLTLLDLGRQPVRGLLQLLGLVRRIKPEVVQTWMYHADLAGGIAARLGGAGQVVWGIRNSTLDPKAARQRTIQVARLCAWLSGRVPTAVVSVSHAAKQIHIDLGYRPRRFEVIGNGFDLSTFQPDDSAREALRRELGLQPDTTIVLHVGRFHAQKNHLGLVRSMGLVHRRLPEVHFVMVGNDVDRHNLALQAAIEHAGIAAHCHALGLRNDTQRLFAGADLAVLPSTSGEAFPRVLGEAMACGTPCVATDVGDSRLIVGECGSIVPPGDDAAFAEAVIERLTASSEDRMRLRTQARTRALGHFDIRAVARQYESLYMNLIGAPTCAA